MVDVCDKSEDLGDATLLFKQAKESNEYLYNAMIRAYAHNEVYRGDITLHKEMLKLRRCYNLLHGLEVFDGMIERDSISWNGIFSGNARLGHIERRELRLIQSLIGLYSILDSNDIRGTRAQMQIVGIEPDNISIISASPASGQPEALGVERDTRVL
ncbi:hypothetical protein POTOM_026345 [Populus tomentosa]|uniref:Pentatricopeptide repeat-containing protein n=1 Tax=Populus tomentosa TaxID=118781 RepID=A0A8X7ZJP2_POPTO|nr:hypothetical protein POTOM_026345 [Populus tomentosa]